MNSNIEEQLKYPPREFAACACRQDCERCDECLRCMTWTRNEQSIITVLREHDCQFYPLRTRIQKSGIPSMRDMLPYSRHQAYMKDLLRQISRSTYYRLLRGEYKPSDRQVDVFEQTWAKYSQEPFPWEHEEEVIVWDNNLVGHNHADVYSDEPL